MCKDVPFPFSLYSINSQESRWVYFMDREESYNNFGFFTLQARLPRVLRRAATLWATTLTAANRSSSWSGPARSSPCARKQLRICVVRAGRCGWCLSCVGSYLMSKPRSIESRSSQPGSKEGWASKPGHLSGGENTLAPEAIFWQSIRSGAVGRTQMCSRSMASRPTTSHKRRRSF